MGKKKDKEKEKKKKAGKGKKTREAKGRQTEKHKKAKAKVPQVSPQQRIDMIAEAAYFIAEKHGFDPTRADQDWHEAEQQVDEMLSSNGIQAGSKGALNPS